jgi:hypothetical protein
MKHIKSFNEAIITPDEDKLKELMNRLMGSRPRTHDQANKISEDYGVKFIPLKDFKNYLETEKEKESVPPPMEMGPFKFLICYNYYLKRVIIACDDLNIITLPPLIDIIRHELIHKEQDKRRGDFTARHLELSPLKKEYWNNYDEIMAYANNIANDIYREQRFVNDPKKAFRKGWEAIQDGRSYRNLIFDIRSELTPENYNKLKKLTFQYLEELFKKDSKETIHSKINKK